MLNRISGWLIFLQLFYVTAFTVLAVVNAVSKGFIVRQISAIRDFIGLPNTHVSFNDYVSYPLAFTSPINTVLALIFVWMLLRRRPGLDFSSHFFSIINAVYVASSSWIFMSLFLSELRR